MSFFKRLKESISSKAEAVTNKFKEGLNENKRCVCRPCG